MITASVMKELNSKLCFMEVRRDLEFSLKNKPIEGISFNPIPNRGEGGSGGMGKTRVRLFIF